MTTLHAGDEPTVVRTRRLRLAAPRRS